MKTHRWMTIVGLVMILALLVPASATYAAPPDQGGKRLMFAMIPKTLDNPGFLIGKRGADFRAAELTKASGTPIDVFWTASTTADAAQEVQVIESLVQRKPDGLLINSNGPSVCDAVRDAMKAGVPVVMWDSDCPDVKEATYVGADNYQGGVKTGELYVEALKGKTGHQKIAILTGVPGVFNLGERDRGFKAALDAAKIDYEIVTTVPGYDDLAKSVDAVESTTRANPDLTGWFWDGPWIMLMPPDSLPETVKGIKAGKLTVVSMDSLEAQLPWIEQGLVYGVVGQKYYGWGYQGLSVMYEIAVNGCKTFPKLAITGLDVVTKDGGEGRFSVAQYAKKWKDFDFAEKPLTCPK
jgi:ribose transport system substrate-binding protein